MLTFYDSKSNVTVVVAYSSISRERAIEIACRRFNVTKEMLQKG